MYRQEEKSVQKTCVKVRICNPKNMILGISWVNNFQCKTTQFSDISVEETHQDIK